MKQKDAIFAGYAIQTPSGPRWTGKVELIESKLLEPLHWKKPRRVFVNSMSDLFHENLSNRDILSVFEVMATAENHTFQILTKRPARMFEFFRAIKNPLEVGGLLRFAWDLPKISTWPLPNIWLGVSVENQQTADERIPLLLQTPAAVRFVSYEPALGPVDFASGLWLPTPGIDPSKRAKYPWIDWIIAGGESGPGARPAHPDWFRSVRDQCQAAGVPFFFKQWGEWVSVSEVGGKGPHFSFSDGATVRRVGKLAAGAVLDGREWREFPSTSQNSRPDDSSTTQAQRFEFVK